MSKLEKGKSFKNKRLRIFYIIIKTLKYKRIESKYKKLELAPSDHLDVEHEDDSISEQTDIYITFRNT